MALSSRDLFLILRARDEASRVLRGFSRQLLSTSAQARAANARNEAAAMRNAAAQARANGATRAQVTAMANQAAALDAEASRLARAAALRQRLSGAIQAGSQALVTSGVILTAVSAGTLYFLANAVKFANEYERQVRLTLTQVNDLGKSVQAIGDIGLRVAQKVGVAFESIQPALYDIFSSTNANMAQAEVLLLGFSKAAVAGQVDIQDASRATIAIMNAYNIPLEKVNDVLDVQFQLVKYGVGTYAEFSKVFGNVIPSATRAGQSFQMVAAMLAYMTRNGMSAAMASTSAARALEAMSHPKTIARLKAMGIDVRDAAGNMRPLTDILGELRAKLEGLPTPEKVARLVELFKGAGGTIQARRFLEQVLLRPGELEELNGFLANMQNSTGAFEDAYNTMADSVSVKTELMKNKWKVLKETMGSLLVPSMIQIIDVISKMLDWFNKLPSGVKNTIAQFALWGSVAGVLGGVLLILLGTLGGIIAAIVAAGDVLAIIIAVFVAVAAEVAALAAAFVYAYQHSNALRLGIQHLWEALQELWAKIVEVAGPIASEIANTIGGKLLEGLRTLGNVAGAFINILAAMIRNYLIPALTAAKTWWDANQESIRPLLNYLGQVAKWIGIVIGVIVLLIAAIGVGGLIAVITAVVAVFIFVIEVIKRVWSAIQLLIGVVRYLIDASNAARGAFSGMGNTIQQVLSSIPGLIRGAFAAAGTWLVNAGRDIIQGLVSGIRGAIGAVRSALGEVTSMIPNWKGPKAKDLKLLAPTGRYLMQGLARGIQEGQGPVKAALGNVTTAVARDYGRPPASPDGGSPKQVSQTFNITTQEIDPRTHAAELGWLLQGTV